ncbi:MAG: hypothetical protein KDC06_12065, partial [Chitinophagaceae bacterium]|nr:hypothetical protein [Chitinophagaceae bacterium]
MKRIKSLLVLIFLVSNFLQKNLDAQGIFTGINNTVVTVPCDQNCTDLNFQVPHLKSDEDYIVTTIPYTPYPYTTPTGIEDPALYGDDKY